MTPTVVIVGRGPIGSKYARFVLEGHPAARVNPPVRSVAIAVSGARAFVRRLGTDAR